MRVAIASVQAPFVSGGAEALAAGLRTAIAARGHPVDIVTLPFRFGPPEQVRRSMAQWESEDFTSVDGYEPDRVIALRFPAYALKHPNKVLWLCHQSRGSYELFDAKTASADEARLRDEVHAFDARVLPTARERYTISMRVAERLRESTGLDSTPLYHPPPLAARCYSRPAEPFIFCPSRIETAKRQELLLRAMALTRGDVVAFIAGEGGQSEAMRKLAGTLGLGDRVRFLGHVPDDELAGFYAHALAVFFGPRDEDYGYVTLEAMLSERPVITCTDSGGPLEFVQHGQTGCVVAPDAQAVAAAIDEVAANRERARAMGRAGLERYHALVPSWDTVAARLVESR